jgi:hypothetical protein
MKKRPYPEYISQKPKKKKKNNLQGRNPWRNQIPEEIRKKEHKRNETLKKSTTKPYPEEISQKIRK